MKNYNIIKNGKEIKGIYYDYKNPKGIIIMSHGFTSNKERMLGYAETFHNEGYSTYAYDFINGGSTGTVENMSVLTEADDLNIVIDHFKGDLPIYLLGASQGGFVSSYVSSQRGDIKACLLLYPAYVLQDDARERRENPFLSEIEVMGHTISPIYNEDALSFDIYDYLKKDETPVIIIHGTSDSIVPIDYAYKAHDTYPNSELKIINGAGHGFYGYDDQKAIGYMKEFLEEVNNGNSR